MHSSATAESHLLSALCDGVAQDLDDVIDALLQRLLEARDDSTYCRSEG